MAFVFLGLGTNLGDKETNLTGAIRILALEVGRVLRQSSFYVSKPWGFESENEFQNAVLWLETELTPQQLLQKTQEIERKLGRTAKTSDAYADRVIDIDILLYDNLIVDDPELKIPHPLMVERDFVLVPITEIVPDLVNPLNGRKYRELLIDKIQ